LNIFEASRFQIWAHQHRPAWHDRPSHFIHTLKERLSIIRLAHVDQHELSARLEHTRHFFQDRGKSIQGNQVKHIAVVYQIECRIWVRQFLGAALFKMNPVIEPKLLDLATSLSEHRLTEIKRIDSAVGAHGLCQTNSSTTGSTGNI
jgi:hypothetical protein